MKAWIVTWEWAGDAAAVADKVVAVLNPRWGERRVSDLVETLYALNNSTLSELASYARRPTDNPYPARRESGRIICGHHPWLEARRVSEFKVALNEGTGLEVISWKEPCDTRPAPDVPFRPDKRSRSGRDKGTSDTS